MWRTVRHLLPRQAAARLGRAVFGRPHPASGRVKEPRSRDLPARLALLSRIALRNGFVEAVGHRRPLADGWDPPSPPSRLWLYHLHYFDWLRQVDTATQAGIDSMRSWICGHLDGVGWDPYPTSRRVVNWIRFVVDRGLSDAGIDASLATQIAHLERTVEWDLLANHLVANLKGLLYGARYFDGPVADRWWIFASRELERQLDIQVLPDGGHEERTPMYHAQVLEDLLDLLAFLPAGEPLAEKLREKAACMMAFLDGILHPDGGLPAFGDTADGMVPEPSAIRRFAASLGVPVRMREGEADTFPDSGLARIRCGPFCLIVRLGPIGPGHQPGHAHADSCSFELSVSGRRVVTDTGCGHYEPGPEREAMRSTAAHSTIEVGGTDSSEVWASHRVGRRARPLPARVDGVGDAWVVECGHDGYRHLRGAPIHRRTFRLDATRLVIEDEVLGRAVHDLRWRLHLAPGLRPEFAEGGVARISLADGGTLVVSGTMPGPLVVVETPSYPAFGPPIRRACLEVVARLELPARFRVEIRLEPAPGERSCRATATNVVS